MEMKDSVSLQKRGAVMEEKTRKPETAKQTAKEHHVPEHEDEHQHGNPQFALNVLLILIAIILVIVILKASGVPFAVKGLAFARHRRHDRATLNVLSP